MLDIMIDSTLKRKYPTAVLGCLHGRVVVHPSPVNLQAELDTVCQNIESSLVIPDIAKRLHIANTRAAYKSFGKDPARYRNSCEALMRRCIQGKGLYRVNNVVDINNLISLESDFSIGLYDVAQLNGPITWSVAPSIEDYFGIGKELLNIEYLPVLSDEIGVFGNPTSDSVRARITEATEEIFLCIFSFSCPEGLSDILNRTTELMVQYCEGHDFTQEIIK